MPFIHYPLAIKLIYVKRLLAGDTLETINALTGYSPRIDTIAVWIHLFETTERVVVNPSFYKTCGPVKLLSEDQRAWLLHAIELDPTLYLHEIARKLNEQLEIRISITTLHRQHICVGWSHLTSCWFGASDIASDF